MELLHCGESRWRNRATPQKWRFVRGHDNLMHGRCAIYFPGGRRGYRSPSLSLSRLMIPSHKAGYFVGGNVAGYGGVHCHQHHRWGAFLTLKSQKESFRIFDALMVGFQEWYIFIWMFPKIGVHQNGWFIMENLLKWMIRGYHYFRKHPYKGCTSQNFVYLCIYIYMYMHRIIPLTCI